VGRAIDALPTLARRGPVRPRLHRSPTSPATTDYFNWALKLSRRGTVIVVDNVVRDGKVLNPAGDESAQGMNAFMTALSAEKRVSATVVQTVGAKGYDGFALAIVETRPSLVRCHGRSHAEHAGAGPQSLLENVFCALPSACSRRSSYAYNRTAAAT
jgi:hypothetical protein